VAPLFWGTPIGGTVEILRGFDISFLFDGPAPEQMADLIFEKYTLYKNKPDAYKQLSLEARRFVEKNYSWENNAGLVESVLKEIASG